MKRRIRNGNNAIKLFVIFESTEMSITLIKSSMKEIKFKGRLFIEEMSSRKICQIYYKIFHTWFFELG